MSFKGQSQYTTNGLLLQFVCKHKPGAPSGDNTNEWVAGCHAWLTFSAMLPTKLAMSGLSDLVTPLGYSPNLKVQFWKSLPSNVRKESKQASICLMNIWHHYRLAIFPPPHSQNNLYLTSTSPYIFLYQTVHLYYTTWRWRQPVLVWMSIQWKEFQTLQKGLILESSMTRQHFVVLWRVLS
jgi:hypothetical protein